MNQNCLQLTPNSTEMKQKKLESIQFNPEHCVEKHNSLDQFSVKSFLENQDTGMKVIASWIYILISNASTNWCQFFHFIIQTPPNFL